MISSRPLTPLLFLVALTLLSGLNPAIAAAEGTLEKILVHCPSLEGSLAGYSADREVVVYLPPSYRTHPRRRYPVTYSLHGFGGSAVAWAKRLGAPQSFDRSFAAGAREIIVVMPDARTPLGGVMFSNSATTGDWESFIAQDLVRYIDAHYRTVARREARGLSGFSMGGYGTLRIAMKRPDVFSSIDAQSSCCLPPMLPPAPEPGAMDRFVRLESVKTQKDAAALEFGAVPLAMASAWSPNPTNPPMYYDLPTRDGKVQPDVIAAWAANAILPMVHQHVPSLRRLSAITIAVGRQDSLLLDNQRLHDLLVAYGIRHDFEVFDGDHGDAVAERFEKHTLPFFSKRLASP